MRQVALTVALTFFFVGGSVTAEAQHDPKQVEQRCDAGDLGACSQLGQWCLLGIEGFKKDVARAVSLFERACNGGNPHGCYRLGEQFRWSDGAPKDVTRAAQLFQKACDGKSKDGCYSLARAYQQGQGVGRDYTRAAALFEQACDLGEISGCMSAADLHHPKESVLRDAKRWAAFMEKACDSHYRGGEICLQLGLVYDLGMWVPKDPNHANDLFKKGCLFGSKEACNLIRR